MEPTNMEHSIDRRIAEYCLHHLAERIEREMLESDSSERCGARFLIGDTGVYGMAFCERDDKYYDAQRLSVGAHHGESDRLWSQTFFVGSTAEVLAKLRDPQTVDEFIRDVAELAAKAAEHHGPETA